MEEKKKFIINFCYYAILIFIAIACMKYVAPVLLPFIIGGIISYMLSKMTKKMFKETKYKKQISIIILLLFYLIIVLALSFLCITGYSFVQRCINQIPGLYAAYIEPFVNDIYKCVGELNQSLSPEIKDTILDLLMSLSADAKNLVMSLSNILIKLLTNLVTTIPNMFVLFVLTIISSFFILIDYDKIEEYCKRCIPDAGKAKLVDISYFVKNKLIVVLKSYIKIMTLTFVELALGFWLLKIDNFVLLAILIAIFDILPVFGVGGVLIPWAIIRLVYKDLFLGIGLLVLYIFITVVRNIVEPKLVGTELGLHPIVTLTCMFLGLKMFGVIGLFGVPIVASFILFKFSTRTTLKNDEKESEENKNLNIC